MCLFSPINLLQLVYSANPSAYSRPEQQQGSGYDPASTAAAAAGGFATGAADDHHQPPHHLADTPAANYLRQQAMHEPSPFNSGPFPTSWQVPSELPRKQHLESLGCSRPIPRRLVANSKEKSVPEATLRAIGLSNNHDDTNSHDEAQTDRLDVLISAIAQSENVGGFEEWQGDGMNGSLPQPNSPASVNTLQDSLQGSPTASAGAPPPPLVHPSLHYVASSHGINEDGPIIMEPAANPVFLHAKPAPAAPPITTTANVSTAAAAGMGSLTDALAQLANNTGYNAPSGSHSSTSTLQSLVKLLAAHPELAGQLQRVLNQPKESSAFAENLHASYNHQQQYQQQPPQEQQQQQQDASQYMQEHPTAPSNEQDLLSHLLQRQQQLQKIAKAVDLEGGGANATAAAAALRRAQLSVKFQAMQAKLAARQSALQKLQNSMDFQCALAGQQQRQQQEQRKQSHILTTATPPLTAVAAPTVAISIAAGNNGNPTFSGGISTNGAAAATTTATIPGITNAPASLTAAQEDRRELYRLLAAKLQQQQQQH